MTKPPTMKSSAAGRKSPIALRGVNRVPRKTSSGVAVHWYAWRGKDAPKIGVFVGATVQEADAAARTPQANAALVEAYAEAMRGGAGALQTLADLAKAYERAPEFARLAESTRREWSKKLRVISTDPTIGKLTVRALNAESATALLLDWRDLFAATPRKADYLAQVLSRVLSWSVKRKLLRRNAMEGAESIYRSDRSSVIVTDGEIARLCAAGTVEFAHAIMFLRLTGFRRRDAIRVGWNHVDEAAGVIVWRTSKTRGKAEQVVEITPELAALLRSIPRRGPTILTSSLGRPWTADGLTASFADARTKAKLEPGADGKPKRLHDLRGTSATDRVASILMREEVRRAHGWTGGDTSAPGAYVDAATVVALIRSRKK